MWRDILDMILLKRMERQGERWNQKPEIIFETTSHHEDGHDDKSQLNLWNSSHFMASRCTFPTAEQMKQQREAYVLPCVFTDVHLPRRYSISYMVMVMHRLQKNCFLLLEEKKKNAYSHLTQCVPEMPWTFFVLSIIAMHTRASHTNTTSMVCLHTTLIRSPCFVFPAAHMSTCCQTFRGGEKKKKREESLCLN